MDLQITKNKAEEWIKQGAPNHALEYLGDTVKSMSEFAEQNDILHKDETPEEDVSEGKTETVVEDTTNEDDGPVVTDTEQDTKEVEASDEDTTKDAESDVTVSADFMAALSKTLNETITVAIKTYHDEVVVPLQKSIEESTKVKEVSGNGNMFEYLLGEDWLPASVMANTIKEQFAASVTSDGNETVTDAQVEASKKSVDEVLNTDPGNSKNYVEGHLFNEF